MNTVKVTFPNASGNRLAGRLDLPEGGQPLAYALFAHCFTCSKDLKAAVTIARTLSERNIAVLRFDFTGLGESEGAFEATNFSTEVSDLLAASRFLEAEHAAPRLLIGHSLGGAAVLAAAAGIPTTAAVVTIGAPFHPAGLGRLLGESAPEVVPAGQAIARIAGRDFTIRKSLLDDLAAQQPAEVLSRLPAALLVMHSPRDRVVGIDNATAIYRAAPHPKSFISLDTADHLLSGSRDARYAGEMIAAWVRRYLMPPEAEPFIPQSPELSTGQVTTRTEAKGFRTEIIASGFSLVADEPAASGGGDGGPTPYDYLLAGLGACTGMTLQMYARRKGWPLEEAVVRLSHQKNHAEDCRDCTDQDRRIETLVRELELRGKLDEAQRQRLLEIAGQCPVHRTLTGEIRIQTTLRTD